MAEKQDKSYTCVIIDDESPAYRTLSFHIAAYPQLKLCGHAFNAVEGLKLVKKLKPDIIFLNETMPYMTGLEMLDHFSTQNHYIILMSALETSTVLDKRVNDFLLVPLSKSLFSQAMKRLEMNI